MRFGEIHVGKRKIPRALEGGTLKNSKGVGYKNFTLFMYVLRAFALSPLIPSLICIYRDAVKYLLERFALAAASYSHVL